jgi:hypothetical protein
MGMKNKGKWWPMGIVNRRRSRKEGKRRITKRRKVVEALNRAPSKEGTVKINRHRGLKENEW